MRKAARFLAGLMVFVALLSCRTLSAAFSTPTPILNPTAPAAPTAPVVPDMSANHLPTLTGDWHISLTQSGGIMGMSRTLEISADGEMTLTDRHSNKTNRTRLPADRLTALTELVAVSEYQPASVPTGCSDCFIFTLKISSSDGKFEVQMNQLDLPNSGLQPIINFLVKYLNDLGT